MFNGVFPFRCHTSRLSSTDRGQFPGTEPPMLDTYLPRPRWEVQYGWVGVTPFRTGANDQQRTSDDSRHIGTPPTNGDVRGCWPFAVGLLLGILGIVGFLLSTPNSLLRRTDLGFAATGLLLLTIGPVIRLPLRRGATVVASVGAIRCIAAMVAS